jgi:hypothetical protein
MLPGELAALQSADFFADGLLDPQNPFGVFKTETGTLQTVDGPNCFNTPTQSGVDVCTSSNPFLTQNFGTAQGNGQDCERATSHNLAGVLHRASWPIAFRRRVVPRISAG